MKYAILKDGYPRYAPSTIIIGDRRVANPTEVMLLSAGYLPVIATEAPQTDAQHYTSPKWVQESDAIRQVWDVAPLPPEEPTLEDRVSDLEYLITGEVTAHAQS